MNILTKLFGETKIISKKIFEINSLEKDKKIYKIKFFIKLFCLFLFFIIFLFPNGIKINSSKSNFSKEIVFVLDISLSMLAKDNEEKNRIERAKNLINETIDKNLGSKFALLVFSGENYIFIPLTGDSDSLKKILERAIPKTNETKSEEISSLEKNIGIIFKASEKKDLNKKYIVLLSDGEFHNESFVLDFFKKTGIKILSIGFGKKEGDNIAIGKKGETIIFKEYNGKKVITKLDETSLKKISQITNGKYFYENEKEKIFDFIEKNFEIIKTKSNEKENFPIFQIIGIILIFLIIIDIFSFKIFRKSV